MGHLDEASDVILQVPEENTNNPEIMAAKAALDLANQSAAVGDLDELKSAVSENPGNHQARLDLAVGLFGAGQREEAIDHLVESMKIDKSWNEEAARKQLIQFFDNMNPTDETTIAGRRKMSAVLFS